ncbi:MAG: 6-phosphogluconolactonase [Gammaproteobacteria bacterium]
MNKIVLANTKQAVECINNSIIALAQQCITETGRFTIALSGGNTPKLLYQHLILDSRFKSLDFSKIHIYFSDERYVSHDDDRSNYGLAVNYLLNSIKIPEANIFPVDTSLTTVVESASIYQKIIQDNIDSNTENIPMFDLILLGMGTDGHTASLFPGSELLNKNDILVGCCFHQESKTDRVSFTFPLINAAKNVFIIALGSEKFKIINDIQKLEKNNTLKYPIQNVKPQGKLTWYIDKAAEQGG